VQDALARLSAAQRLNREQLVDQYLCLSQTRGKKQLERRYEATRRAHEQEAARRSEVSQELRESVQVLLSVLDEKQRRLYLGLESIRLGQGGDPQVARMAGVYVKTVARGRRQLLARRVTPEQIPLGGSRPPDAKKNRSDRLARGTDARENSG
jgi:hypothetical protein